MTEKTVNPTREALTLLRELPPDQPVVMLNLLHYREQAAYPADAEATPCSGREAYKRYSRIAQKHVAAIGGELAWLGSVQAHLIAPAQERWDDVMLVRYPSVAAFLQMLADPEYQAATVHRTAALEDSRLIATSQLIPAADG